MSTICLCISGQMRASTLGLESLKRALEGQSATIVFSVWSRFGRKAKGAINSDQLHRMFAPDALMAFPTRWLGWSAFSSALPDLLPAEAAAADDDSDRIRDLIRSFFPDAIIDIEDDRLLDLGFDEPREDGNSIRMLYKIWRANEIKRKIERTAGRFDFVYRLRPDTIVHKIDNDLLGSRGADRIVFVNSYIPGAKFVGDTFAAGSSRAVDAYAGLFGKLIADRGGWQFIHSEIHDQLERSGLTYESYPHYGDLAPDLTISARAVAAYLDTIETGGASTPLHDLTRRTMSASADLAEGDASGALARLADAPVHPDPAHLDGYLTVLGAALKSAGRPQDAICCWLLVLHVAETHFGPDRNRTHQNLLAGELLDEMVRAAGSEDASGLADLLDRIAGRLRALAGEFPAVRRVGDPSDLASDGRKALDAIVADGTLRSALAARSLQATDDHPGARATLMRVARWARLDLHTLYHVAQKLKLAGSYAGARQWQEWAVSLDPDHPGAVRQLAEICFHLGDTEGGIRYAREALNRLPGDLSYATLVRYGAFATGAKPDRPAASGGWVIDEAHDFRRLPRFERFLAEDANG